MTKCNEKETDIS